MTPLTLILPFYRNSGMLREQQRVWQDYAPEVRAALHVIVVDDCSPKAERAVHAIAPSDIASLRLFRTLKKARWNWLFSRNLGVANATTDWVLLTDIDHLVPPPTMARLLSMPLDPSCVYRLARADATRLWPYALSDCPVRENKRFHPNTWLMTRAMFDRIGGYDERLSGCYGTDGEFRDRVNAASRAVVCLPDVMIRYGREIIPDASTSPEEFTRKNDPVNDAELNRRKAARAEIPHWRPLRLTFPFIEETLQEVAC